METCLADLPLVDSPFVFSLPMRDGNSCEAGRARGSKLVFSLPMRDGNWGDEE